MTSSIELIDVAMAGSQSQCFFLVLDRCVFPKIEIKTKISKRQLLVIRIKKYRIFNAADQNFLQV